MHFLASIWVSQTGSPTVLCLPSCCLFHSMRKWSTHTCLFNKWQGPDRAVGLGLWSWLHTLFIGDFPKPFVFRTSTSPESCHSLLWDDPYSSSGFCGLSYEEAALGLGSLFSLPLHPDRRLTWNMCRGVTAGKQVASRVQHRVLSQLPPSSVETPASAFLKVTVRTMERTGFPNASPHSEDAEVWKPADVTLRLGQGGGIFWERLGLSSYIHMARDELSDFSYWAPSNHLGSVVFFPPGVCSSQGG